jgi:hypothetical protein
MRAVDGHVLHLSKTTPDILRLRHWITIPYRWSTAGGVLSGALGRHATGTPYWGDETPLMALLCAGVLSWLLSKPQCN